MTGSKAQWYNGILLLGSFLCCRLLWGTYQSIRVYQDVWAGLHLDTTARLAEQAKASIFEPFGEEDEVMRYAADFALPKWLAATYLISNTVLNTLNFYWFGKMIETVRKRFRDPKTDKKKEAGDGVIIQGLADSETIGEIVVDGPLPVDMDGKALDGDASEGATATAISIQQKEVKKRKDKE